MFLPVTADHVAKARQAAAEALDLAPDNAKAWVRLGDAYRARHRWQCAHMIYQEALKLSPHDTAIQVARLMHTPVLLDHPVLTSSNVL